MTPATALFLRLLPEEEQITRERSRARGPEAADEATQNTTALAWKHWTRLDERGKADGADMLRAVWAFAWKQHRAGRQITRGDGRHPRRGKSRTDVYDQEARQAIERPDFNYQVGDRTPVPDAVAFRIDTPRFLATINPKARAIVTDLADGYTATETAARHGLTPGRISQIRARFKLEYDRFNDATPTHQESSHP